VSDTADLIAQSFACWGEVPRIVHDVFEDIAPTAMAAALDEFCKRVLGAGLERGEFFDASVGSVHGLRLRDGRRVVVKLHGNRASAAFLVAVQAVQRHLCEKRFPAPEPLVAPTPFGRGLATAEALLDHGEYADAHEPPIRRAVAQELARFIAHCRPLGTPHDLDDHLMTVADGGLWPTPHDGRFDFEATKAGADWIDAFALRARRVRDGGDGVGVGDRVIGHSDWRVQHLRFGHGRLSAVYDWDSVIVEREPVLVGMAAHGFTANYATDGPRRQRPTLEESVAFIAEYETARPAPFSKEERLVARASLVYAMAYTARCEHSDALLMPWGEPQTPPDSARAFLIAHATGLLTTVGGSA